MANEAELDENGNPKKKPKKDRSYAAEGAGGATVAASGAAEGVGGLGSEILLAPLAEFASNQEGLVGTLIQDFIQKYQKEGEADFMGELLFPVADAVVGLLSARHAIAVAGIAFGKKDTVSDNQRAFAWAAIGASAIAVGLVFLAPATLPFLAAKIGLTVLASMAVKRAKDADLAEKSAKGLGRVLPGVQPQFA